MTCSGEYSGYITKSYEQIVIYRISADRRKKCTGTSTSRKSLCSKTLWNIRTVRSSAKLSFQNDLVSMTVFSFDKGEEISSHSAGGDAMVTVLEGVGRFTVDGEVFILEEGETLIMPKGIPHAVFGEEKFKMQLTVSF